MSTIPTDAIIIARNSPHGRHSSNAKRRNLWRRKQQPQRRPAGKTGGQGRKRRRRPPCWTPIPRLKTTVAQIEKQFGEGAIMPLGGQHVCQITGISTGSLSLGPGPGRPGHSPRPHRGDLRPGIQRQDDAGLARRGPGPAQGRHRRLHRRRTRPGPQLGQEAGRRAGNAPGQPARQRRRGDAHRRNAHQVQRRRRDRHRLRGRPGAQEGTGRRDRRFARRPASPADEPVAAQADRA